MPQPSKRYLALFIGLALALAGCDPTPPPAPPPTPLASATPRATAAPSPTLTTTPAATALPRPAPAIYRFMDAPAVDYASIHPEYGPVGNVIRINWETINPAPGLFDWAPIDSLLAREAGLQVTLPGGRTIAKPVALDIALYRSDNPAGGGHSFSDCTPQWVYEQIGNRPRVAGRLAGHLITCGGERAVVPAYDQPIWRAAFAEMVRALGARYQGHPQIQALFICTGIDGETQATKNTSACKYKELLAQQAPGLDEAFNAFVFEAMRVYREAFPNDVLYINNAPGQRRQTSEFAASLVPPIGIKNSGLDVDLESQMGYGPYVGLFDMWEVYSNTLPIWLETRYGLGNAETRYWTFLTALHYHPDAIDVHKEFLSQSDPGWLAFVAAHLGQTITSTPDVWIVLRDSEFPKVLMNPSSGSAQSGKVGNWDYWLYSLENAPQSRTVRLWRQDLPGAAQGEVYSRQARRTDQATSNLYMSFNIDDRYPFAGQPPVAPTLPAPPPSPPPVNGGTKGGAPSTAGVRGAGAAWCINVTLLNTGSDTFSLQYLNGAGQMITRTVRKGAELGPVDRWLTVSFPLSDAYLANGLPGGADFRLSCNGDGDEIVHMVRVAGAWGTPPQGVPAPGQTSVVERRN